jgi:nitrous oxidase accessory protein NosD
MMAGLVLAGCASADVVTGDLGAAIASAEPGAVLELGAQSYSGPILIDKAITLVGRQGTVIDSSDGAPAIMIDGANGVSLKSLLIRGGDSGILVRHSEDVTIEDVSVEQALWHGILAQDSQLTVSGCRVSGLRAPMPQGIEIINSDSRPPSFVTGCRIEGPVFEGLAAHVSHVTFADNVVVGATQRGVVITEMSDGLMEGNTVSESGGTAYFCGDMSNCSIVDNTADGIGVGDDRLSAMGHGVVVHYYANAFVTGLEFDGLSGQDVLPMLGGKLVDEAPYP